jgi:GNAT superfamily N-acetyltransferase
MFGAQRRGVMVELYSSADLDRLLDAKLALKPLAVDDFSTVRHLHANTLRKHTLGVLSDAEVADFVRLVYSPAYATVLMREDVYCAWLDAELVGTISWQANAANGLSARIGCIFVRHPLHGIGRRLLAEVELRAHQGGFARLGAGVTANAVPFLQRFGYAVVSSGVKTLGGSRCSLPVVFLRKELSAPNARLN